MEKKKKKDREKALKKIEIIKYKIKNSEKRLQEISWDKNSNESKYLRAKIDSMNLFISAFSSIYRKTFPGKFKQERTKVIFNEISHHKFFKEFPFYTSKGNSFKNIKILPKGVVIKSDKQFNEFLSDVISVNQNNFDLYRIQSNMYVNKYFKKKMQVQNIKRKKNLQLDKGYHLKEDFPDSFFDTNEEIAKKYNKISLKRSYGLSEQLVEYYLKKGYSNHQIAKEFMRIGKQLLAHYRREYAKKNHSR